MPLPPLTAFLIGLAIGLILLVIFLLRAKLRHQSEIDLARKQSVKQSRHTIKGQMAEQMAPFLPGFDYAPADSKFLGDPIDYVIFNGMTEARDGGGAFENLEVVLIDVKYGKAQLTPAQRAIAAAVDAGRVRFEVVRIDSDHNVTKSQHTPRHKNASTD
ncbi:MAG: endonuclease [Planctomycetota bacterium]|nr:endonuclease [Planctomycetota bacterium]